MIIAKNKGFKKRCYGQGSLRNKGQAMVELALSLPLLLAVLAVIIEISMLISHASALQEAVNQAGRYAAENRCTISEVKKRVASFLESDGLLKEKDLSVDVEESVDSQGASMINLYAKLKLHPFAFENLGTFTVTAAATYRKEWSGVMP